jgi:hypothetical protein
MQQSQQIKLDLALQEVNALLQILGDLPTKTGVYSLLMKIEYQAKKQLEAKEDSSE